MALNVMFVNHTARMGGAEKVLFQYLKHIDRNRIQPILISPEGELSVASQKEGIKWVALNDFDQMTTTRSRLKIKDAYLAFKSLYKLRNLVAKYNPDVLFSNSVKAHVMVNGMKQKVPTVMRLHDFPQTFDGLSLRLLRVAVKNVDHVSCVSQSVADNLRAIIHTHEKISSTYNGVAAMQEAVESIQHVQRKRIVVAGWLLEWKGFDVFVDAVNSIADKLPEWEFVIAGAVAEDVLESGDYAVKLREKVANSPHANRITFHGGYHKISEVACCASHCIFVQPSTRPDPLPTVLLEAASLGLPIISSKLGGSKEILVQGETGFLVSPTPEEVAEKMMELAENSELRGNLGRKAKLDNEERFTMQAYVDGITKIIESFTGGRP